MKLSEIKSFLQENGIESNETQIEDILKRAKLNPGEMSRNILSLMLDDFRSGLAPATAQKSELAVKTQPQPKTDRPQPKTEGAIEFRPVQELGRAEVAIELSKATQEAEAIMIRIDEVDSAEYERLEIYFDELSQYIDRLNEWQMQLAQVSLNRLMSGRITALETLAKGMDSVSASTQKQLEVLRSGNRDRFQRMGEFVSRISG